MREVTGIKAKKITYTIQKNSHNSTYMYPLVIADGHDCMIKDIDGYEFLDFTSNIGIGKIAGQDFYCEEHAQLSKNLLLILSDKFKIFLSNSGTDAVENSIALSG